MINDLVPVLVGEAAEARAKIEQAYRDTLSLLKKRGVLTVEEANPLKPKITVTVSDNRRDKTTPLPKFD